MNQKTRSAIEKGFPTFVNVEPPPPALRDLHPLPETPEAVARGCICTVLRNADNSQRLSQDGLPLFIMEKGCPLHG